VYEKYFEIQSKEMQMDNANFFLEFSRSWAEWRSGGVGMGGGAG
jgi:hypothetical protein